MGLEVLHTGNPIFAELWFAYKLQVQIFNGSSCFLDHYSDDVDARKVEVLEKKILNRVVEMATECYLVIRESSEASSPQSEVNWF